MKVRLILVAAFLLRVALTMQVPFSDGPAFRFWGMYLQDHTLGSLFKNLPGGYTPYPPLYYYMLFLLGRFVSVWGIKDWWFVSEIVFRFFIYLADIGTGYFIFRITSKLFGKKSGFISLLVFLFNPALLITSTLWAQNDSIILFFSLASVYFLLREKWVLGWTLFLAGLLIKVQILALLPLVFALSFPAWQKAIKAFPFFILFIFLPFAQTFWENGIAWSIGYFLQLPNWYPYTSIYATNLWAVYGFIIPDSLLFLGIPLKIVSLVLISFLVIPIVLKIARDKSSNTVYWSSLLLFFTFALFSTRVHSRYFIYLLPFLSLFCTRYILLFICVTFIMLFNLFLPAKGIGIDWLIDSFNQKEVLYSMILLSFAAYIYVYRQLFLLTKKPYEK